MLYRVDTFLSGHVMNWGIFSSKDEALPVQKEQWAKGYYYAPITSIPDDATEENSRRFIV